MFGFFPFLYQTYFKYQIKEEEKKKSKALHLLFFFFFEVMFLKH